MDADGQEGHHDDARSRGPATNNDKKIKEIKDRNGFQNTL
jgi:hypothetical protein